MSDEVRTVRANGIRIAYRTWGAQETDSADGTPVVLLHCLGEDGEDWRGPLIAQLAAAHPVYAPDLRGHGGSDRPGRYAMEDYSEDLRCFLDRLGLERIVLVGHSLGSVIAGIFAGRHPERVEHLVLEETAAMLPLDPPREIPEPPPEAPQFDFEVRRQWNRQRNEPDPLWWERLRAITAPTLVVGGGSGSHLPQEDMAAVARHVPDGTFVTLDGGGHMVHEQRPLEFAATVRAFLAGETRLR
ncbi:pimeloyl-ACP methyl ester carboxylesterase [Streptomyces sp. Amel2xB2]|uniref:alpha/beta fold hydrolase n=1 Tax=Streptomyces sp. Amel2xB2 TaxID=1305829 RepID=UPI000DB93DCF|nr:alpha/beta hydrolase [Streptomyces sp. Amel2xB2]RAJ56139.1 pimeloyl-ACP methyl ester carboxylesterase [Streptomyces sp. Amel2xB2]